MRQDFAAALSARLATCPAGCPARCPARCPVTPSRHRAAVRLRAGRQACRRAPAASARLILAMRRRRADSAAPCAVRAHFGGGLHRKTVCARRTIVGDFAGHIADALPVCCRAFPGVPSACIRIRATRLPGIAVNSPPRLAIDIGRISAHCISSLRARFDAGSACAGNGRTAVAARRHARLRAARDRRIYS
jgi:hypothetical protein